jgi:hypothetical protein
MYAIPEDSILSKLEAQLNDPANSPLKQKAKMCTILLSGQIAKVSKDGTMYYPPEVALLVHGTVETLLAEVQKVEEMFIAEHGDKALVTSRGWTVSGDKSGKSLFSAHNAVSLTVV